MSANELLEASTHLVMEDSQTSRSISEDIEKQFFNESHHCAAVADPLAQNAKEENIVGWDGPDDAENPLNWPTAKKAIAISIVSLLTMLS
jgi:hypothetical protein